MYYTACFGLHDSFKEVPRILSSIFVTTVSSRRLFFSPERVLFGPNFLTGTASLDLTDENRLEICYPVKNYCYPV